VKSEWAWEVILVRDDLGALVGSLAVLIRKVPFLPWKLLYAPRGPVFDTDDHYVLSQLIQGARGLAEKHKAYALKLDPDIACDNSDFIEAMRSHGFELYADGKNFEGIQPRFVFRLDIAGMDEDQVMARFHEKWRYNIRLAVRKGVKVEVCGKERLKDFYDLMIVTGMRDRFITRPYSYFERMMDSMGSHLRMYMAFYKEIPIAGALSIHFGDKVWYLYGASSNDYRNVMPNYLLQWEMIRWAIAERCRIYDFRGVSGDLTEDNPLYGLYRFKKGFGGKLTEFCGEFELCMNPSAKRLVESLHKMYSTSASILYRLRNRAKS